VLVLRVPKTKVNDADTPIAVAEILEDLQEKDSARPDIVMLG